MIDRPLASLPMYDRPEAQGANDRLWDKLRDRLRTQGVAAPECLTRTGDLWDHWQAPDLLLSQTCGLPFRARLHTQVTLVASPDYGIEGCAPGYYRSVLIARASDRRSSVEAFSAASLAINDALSQSGWGAIWEHARDRGISLRPGLETGGHRESALAVAEGRADWASIDAMTWRMIARWDDWATGLKVIGQTRPTPALPFITRPGQDSALLRGTLAAAIAALDPSDRDCLSLRGLATIPAEDYLAVPIPPSPWQIAG